MHRAPSVGFEPTQPAPEAGALSPELRGLGPPTLVADPRAPTRRIGRAPVTIVVVDDDTVIKAVLADNLEMEGYPVVTGIEGAEALDMIAAERPAAVVLDVMMPKID